MLLGCFFVSSFSSRSKFGASSPKEFLLLILLSFGAVGILFGVLWGSPALANTITVAPGAVASANDGICSLVEAIYAANWDTAVVDCPAGSGADIIELASSSTYTMTFYVDGDEGLNGLPSITSQITINGNGATIERSSSLTCDLDGRVAGAEEFRIFRVSSTGNLTLNSVTLKNGCADGDNPGSYYSIRGGGIFNNGGLVTINNSTLSGNFALMGGGGIYNHNGTISINNSTISGNSTAVGLDGGGGIYSDGTVTVTNSTISGNHANNRGGGISGSVTIINSTISGNQATNNSEGGGIAGGSVRIVNSTISDNHANQGGASAPGSPLSSIALSLITAIVPFISILTPMSVMKRS
uniref:Polymorphic outer membrane protein n=1 Tax=uncultured Acetothermia bacterium TaxID=236499 RepID=H5SET6_9BACT|nr:polymorphic outer membrane protein [uncultured Acetothermia bacterium]